MYILLKNYFIVNVFFISFNKLTNSNPDKKYQSFLFLLDAGNSDVFSFVLFNYSTFQYSLYVLQMPPNRLFLRRYRKNSYSLPLLGSSHPSDYRRL